MNDQSPTSNHWMALVVAIAASQAERVLLKLGASDLLFYVVALRRISMSIALPCTAVSYVSAALFGMLLFHEAMTPVKFGGLLLVCASVVLLAEFGGRLDLTRQ